MQPQSNNSTKTILIIIACAVVVVALIFGLTSHKTPQKKTEPQNTTFSSPLTKTSDNLVITYGGSADPNADAVVTQYRLFGVDKLPLTSRVREQLQATLPTYIQSLVQPTFQYTYVHIVKDSIHYTSIDDYSFDFYLDSPESYFHFAKKPGVVGNPVTQLPWEGIQ